MHPDALDRGSLKLMVIPSREQSSSAYAESVRSHSIYTWLHWSLRRAHPDRQSSQNHPTAIQSHDGTLSLWFTEFNTSNQNLHLKWVWNMKGRNITYDSTGKIMLQINTQVTRKQEAPVVWTNFLLSLLSHACAIKRLWNICRGWIVSNSFCPICSILILTELVG